MNHKCDTVKCSNTARPGKRYCHKCRQRKYRINNPVVSYYHALKSRAKRRHINFTLTRNEFENFCLDTGYISKRLSGMDITIDRIKETGPYGVGNLQLLTRSDNSRKGRLYQLGRFEEFYEVSIERMSEQVGKELFYSGNPL